MSVMREIKKVLICGIGAIGSIYADKINSYDKENLRALVDKSRLEKYKKSPKIFNGKPLDLNYILPEEQGYEADLIIIATKADGLDDAIKNIKNFVGENTIIMSLLNGVFSEERIAEKYGWKHTLLSYFIGHSSMREGNKITFDGTGDVVFGIKDDKTDKEDVEVVKKYFDKLGISYKIPENMQRAYWLKFMLNVSSNQPSAVLKMTFGQMQTNPEFMGFMKNIMKEVLDIAKSEGVQDTGTMIDEAIVSFNKMIPEGRTSMLQDIEAHRKTEVDIFAGTVIELGKKHNIPTPYNKVLYEMIKTIESNFS